MDSLIQTLLTVLYFLIAIGVLVAVHEFGHFLMARLSGMQVDHYALGMGWRLFGYNKVSGFTFGALPENLNLNGHCDYHLAALPIGGSCKIAGMVDESFDTEFKDTPPKTWEFRAKSAPKKALAISGGVLFNLLLAIIFLAIVAFATGNTTYKVTQVGAVQPNSIGSFLALQPNDIVLAVNDTKPEHWHQLLAAITTDHLGDDLYIKVNRTGQDTILFADSKALTNKLVAETPLGIEPAGIKTIAIEVMKGSLAEAAGIKANDTITAVSGQLVLTTNDLITHLKAHKNQAVTISIKNAAGTADKHITLTEAGTIGVSIATQFAGPVTSIKYGAFEAVAVGAKQSFEMLYTIIISLKQIVVGEMEFKSAVGGPVMIAKQAGQFAERGLYSFLTFTAMLSLSLALINILPFPALDGGHLIIIIIEGITRREIPLNAKLNVQKVGIFVLLSFMAFVIYNDISKLL